MPLLLVLVFPVWIVFALIVAVTAKLKGGAE